MLPGFKSRLVAELNELLQRSPYKDELAITSLKFHQIPAKENYVAWLGGKGNNRKLTCFDVHTDEIKTYLVKFLNLFRLLVL